MLAELEGKLDLSRVHFVGHIPYERYLALLQVSRVHAYLSYPFVLSWSMMEAMAVGCNVIASDTGPCREMIRDGETGTLVDFFDIEGWSAAIIEGLSNPEAAMLRRAAARSHIRENYDLKTVCLPRLIAFTEGAGA